MPILSLKFARRAVWGDPIHSVALEVVIEAVAVIRAIADEMLGLGLQHVEVEAELHQGDLMMVGQMGTDGEGQPMPINNRDNLHALAAFGETDGVPPPLAAANVASMKLSRSSNAPSSRSVLANWVRMSRRTSR